MSVSTMEQPEIFCNNDELMTKFLSTDMTEYCKGWLVDYIRNFLPGFRSFTVNSFMSGIPCNMVKIYHHSVTIKLECRTIMAKAFITHNDLMLCC